MNLHEPEPQNILIRATNWVGDAIMTTPALAAARHNFPRASITVLARPWVAPVYAHHPAVDGVMEYDKTGRHKGFKGLWRMAAEIRDMRFDLAILFQNALEAALLAWLAGIPRRLGYNTDGRGLLLNPAIRLRPEDKKVHETEYYLRVLARAGLDAPLSPPVFHPSPEALDFAGRLLDQNGIAGDFLLGIAPGAAYGPAKEYPPDRFALAADRILNQTGGAALVFGSRSEAAAANGVVQAMKSRSVDLSGQTNLDQAAALIGRCKLFLTNDSGLMHLAAAVGVPLVAVFGSTNPVTTSPAGGPWTMVRRVVPCAPCMKPRCDQPRHFCMEAISPDDVAAAGLKLLAESGGWDGSGAAPGPLP